MPTFPCPHCAAAFEVEAHLPGTVVTCPACQGTTAVPQSAAGPEPAVEIAEGRVAAADPDEPEDAPAFDLAPQVVSLRKTRAVAGWCGWVSALFALTAIGLYFMPLVDIGKDTGAEREKHYAAQSGFQAACGRKSWAPEDDSWTAIFGGPSIEDEELKLSALMIGYPAAVVIGVSVCMVPLSAPVRFGVAFTSAALAACLLVGQDYVRFPLSVALTPHE